MMTCSVVFFPWALPRETVSGFVGRCKLNGRRIAVPLAKVIDAIYHWEPNHCEVIALQELEMRKTIYDDTSLHWP